MEKQYGYKVVQKLGDGKYVSCRLANDNYKARVIYRKGEWSTTHDWLFKLESCRSFCQIYYSHDDIIFKVKVSGKMKLPKKKLALSVLCEGVDYIPDRVTKKFLFKLTHSVIFPIGSMMYKKVKLIEEINP